MSVEPNKALVRRFYEEIDKGNLEALDELVASFDAQRNSDLRFYAGTAFNGCVLGYGQVTLRRARTNAKAGPLVPEGVSIYPVEDLL